MVQVESTKTTVRTADEAKHFWEAVEADLRDFGWSEQSIFGIGLAFHEAVTNALKHGNELNQAKKVLIETFVDSKKVSFQITDEGKGFDPQDVPDPWAPENLERPCGRGLLLMREYMTEVTYNATGNQVTMTKTRNLMP